MVVFSDGDYATNADGSSQLGFMMFITDNSVCNLISYKRYKSKIIVRSPLAAKTLALEDAADAAILLQHDLKTIHGRNLPITLRTDAKSLFDVIDKKSSTCDKRLMIDIESTNQSYDEEVINVLGWIRR